MNATRYIRSESRQASLELPTRLIKTPTTTTPTLKDRLFLAKSGTTKRRRLNGRRLIVFVSKKNDSRERKMKFKKIDLRRKLKKNEKKKKNKNGKRRKKGSIKIKKKSIGKNKLFLVQ